MHGKEGPFPRCNNRSSNSDCQLRHGSGQQDEHSEVFFFFFVIVLVAVPSRIDRNDIIDIDAKI